MKSGVKLKSQSHRTAKQPAPKRRPLAAKKPVRDQPLKSVDALLDEALGDTFPASDPVALTAPSRRRPPARKPATSTRRSRRYTE